MSFKRFPFNDYCLWLQSALTTYLYNQLSYLGRLVLPLCTLPRICCFWLMKPRKLKILLLQCQVFVSVYLFFEKNPHWVIFILIKQGRLRMAAGHSTDLEWGPHWPLKQHYVTASLLPWECRSLDQKKARSALLGYTCDAPFKDVTDAQHYPEVWGQKSCRDQKGQENKQEWQENVRDNS